MALLGDTGCVAQVRRKHLVIAGTGRAGTSFLVPYLTDLGLETHISRNGDGAWDDAAQAGLEDAPWDASDLPYVLKSPWAYQFIEETLANPAIEIEAMIIPMRDLVDAVTSRIVLELRDIHERVPWMAAVKKTWDDWCHTHGGMVFSLNPLDQARVLAVGFHRLVERLVDADIPMIFVAFPRLAENPDYLFEKLKPVLPMTITRDQARRSHQRIADLNLVRVGRERRAGTGMPSFEELDNIALRRELGRMRERLAAAEHASAELPRLREKLAAAEQAAGELAQSRRHPALSRHRKIGRAVSFALGRLWQRSLTRGDKF